jgi:hypothetical protein
MVHRNIRALGALSVLGLGPRAEAGEDFPAIGDGVKVTFQVVKKKGATMIETYAENTTDSAVMIDDDPYVRSATLTDGAGHVTALQPLNTAELFTRAGPRRHWLSVQAGEKLLVGTTQVDGRIGDGKLTVTVELVAPGAERQFTGTVVLAREQS